MLCTHTNAVCDLVFILTGVISAYVSSNDSSTLTTCIEEEMKDTCKRENKKS